MSSKAKTALLIFYFFSLSRFLYLLENRAEQKKAEQKKAEQKKAGQKKSRAKKKQGKKIKEVGNNRVEEE